MTCIVGITHMGTVYVGGDSAAIGHFDLSVRKDRKVFINDGYLIGFTTSFRMGQLLRYAFKPPHPDKRDDLFGFMTTTWMTAVRNCLKDGGFAAKDRDVELGGCFLVGYKSRLFRIDSDYQVGEMADGFTAVGCGEPYAMGAMHAFGDRLTPEVRIRGALKIAERCSAGVRGPFYVLNV